MDVYDPWARADEVRAEYKIGMIKDIRNRKYDAIVLAVAHDAFRSLDIASLKKKKSVVYDVKGFFEFATDGRL